MMCLGCLSCSTLPRGFVGSSDGFIIPGVCESKMSFDECTQSCVAKNQMSVCRVCSVGFCKATMSTVCLLSLQTGVGSVCLNPNSCEMDQMCFAVLAAVTAAINSASVEPSAVGDCVLDPWTIAPPECVNTHPVVDLLFWMSLEHAASTNPINFPCAIDSGCCLSSNCMRSGVLDSDSSALMF